jgi:hypothetical protein
MKDDSRVRFLFVLVALTALTLVAMVQEASAWETAASISPGTAITLQNWQRYRQFMSEGLVELFQGGQFWRLPNDLRIEVGPTAPIPLPKAYLADTAAYSNRVKLIRTSGGGYVPIGYVAGLPFPHPMEGEQHLIGERIFWDAYYRYQPRVQSAPGFSYTLDRFGNMTQTSEVRAVDSQTHFLKLSSPKGSLQN